MARQALGWDVEHSELKSCLPSFPPNGLSGESRANAELMHFLLESSFSLHQIRHALQLVGDVNKYVVAGVLLRTHFSA